MDALPRKCVKNVHIISGGYRLLWSTLVPGLRTGSTEGMSQVPRRLGDWAASLLSESWVAHRERPGGHWEKRSVSFGQVLNIKYGGGQIRHPTSLAGVQPRPTLAGFPGATVPAGAKPRSPHCCSPAQSTPPLRSALVFPFRNGPYICMFISSPESGGHRNNTSVPFPHCGKKCVCMWRGVRVLITFAFRGGLLSGFSHSWVEIKLS